jgi:cytosine deaminase
MLQRAMLIGYRSGLYTDEELSLAFDLATTNAARALGLSEYGLKIGAPADLVALPVRQVPEAVVVRPAERTVFKSGQIVASNGSYLGRQKA